MHAPSVFLQSGPRRTAGSAASASLARVAIALVLGALLAGCGTTMHTGIDMVRAAFGGKQDLAPVAAKVAASPYASLMMDDGRSQAVMILGNDDEGRLSWHSGRQILFLCGGLVCGTHGLAADLDGMKVEGTNPFADLRALGDGSATVARRYDWRDGYRYGIPVTGTVQRAGQDAVDILGRTRNLLRYEERLQGPGVEGRNLYWIDPATGTLWKSRQLVAPGTYVEIVQLKPYRRRPQ